MAQLIIEAQGHYLALPVEVVREVVRSGLPQPLPRAPFGCLGVVDVRGVIVPVVSLATLVGLAPPPKAESLQEAVLRGHVVLCEFSGAPIALLTTRVLDMVESPVVPLAGADVPLWARAAQTLAGTVRFGEQTAWALNPATLVGKGRRALLRKAAASAAP